MLSLRGVRGSHKVISRGRATRPNYRVGAVSVADEWLIE